MTAAIKTSGWLAVIALSVVPTLFFSPTHAKNLGVQGEVWAVGEEDLLGVIQARAKAWEANGGRERYEAEMVSKTRAYVSAPTTLYGFTAATKTTSRLFDPSMTLRQDLADQDGRVFAHAGSVINPLDYTSLSKDLLFIDGREEAQVMWALGQTSAKIILVAGPVMTLQQQHGRQMYFDQRSLLSNRFSLSRTPTRISQQGRMLRITEVALNERGEEQ